MSWRLAWRRESWAGTREGEGKRGRSHRKAAGRTAHGQRGAGARGSGGVACLHESERGSSHNAARRVARVRVAVAQLPVAVPPPAPKRARHQRERVRASRCDPVDPHVTEPCNRSRDGQRRLVAVPQHTLPPAAEAQQRAVGAEDKRVKGAAAHLHCRPQTGRRDRRRRGDGLAPFAILSEAEVRHEGLALVAQRGAPAGEHVPVADGEGVVATGSTRRVRRRGGGGGCGLGKLVHGAGRREVPHRAPALDGLTKRLKHLERSEIEANSSTRHRCFLG